MNILPTEQPNAALDRVAAATVATIEQWPSLYRRVVALVAGPAFDALDKAFAASLEELRAELNLMGSTIVAIAAEKEAAETECRNLELRVEELRGGDDLANAIRDLYRRREKLILQRCKKIDLQFADCRDEKRRLETQLAEAARERTGAARYIVELEDRVRELEGDRGAA